MVAYWSNLDVLRALPPDLKPEVEKYIKKYPQWHFKEKSLLGRILQSGPRDVRRGRCGRRRTKEGKQARKTVTKRMEMEE